MSKAPDFLPSDVELRFIELLESNPELRRHESVAHIQATHFSQVSLRARFEKLVHRGCLPADTGDSHPIHPSPRSHGRKRVVARREFTRLARELDDRAIRRKATEVVGWATERLSMWNADCRAILGTAIADLRKLLREDAEVSSRLRRKRAAVSDLLEHLEQEGRRSYREERLWTPFPSLDGSIGRFLPGRVYVFIGGPSVGKSALAIQFAAHFVGTCEQRTALFSSHLPIDRLVRGFVVAGSRCGIPGSGDRRFTDSMISAIWEGTAELEDGRVEISYGPQATFTDLELLLESFREGTDPSALIVDGLTSSMLGGDYGSVGLDRALARFREIAVDRKLAIIVFAGRQDDDDEAWRSATPQHPNRLRLDGPTVSHADLVGSLWDMTPRETWKSADEADQVTGLCLCENSFGPVTLIYLQFDHENLVFEEVEEVPSEEDTDE